MRMRCGGEGCEGFVDDLSLRCMTCRRPEDGWPLQVWVATAVSRPENILRVGRSIQDALLAAWRRLPPIQVGWVLSIDSRIGPHRCFDAMRAANQITHPALSVVAMETTVQGETRTPFAMQWQVALDYARSRAQWSGPCCYFCILDDDNVMHEQFLVRLGDVVGESGPSGVFFSQVLPDGQIRHIRPTSFNIGMIDAAQGVLRMSTIAGLNFDPSYAYNSDGHWLVEARKRMGDDVLLLDEPLTYWNALRV